MILTAKMRNFIIIMLTLLTFSFNSSAQVPPAGETRIVINKQGDTVLLINLSDAKIILSDLLDKPIVDSLIIAYKNKDIQSNAVISLLKSQIDLLQAKSDNRDEQTNNLNQMISNKDIEISLTKNEILELRKELKKQRVVKKIAISTAIILPLLILFYK